MNMDYTAMAGPAKLFDRAELADRAKGAQLGGNLGALLSYMAMHGQSVDLNWGEDTGQWECSWISSGRRFNGYAMLPERAATRCAEMMLAMEASE